MARAIARRSARRGPGAGAGAQADAESYAQGLCATRVQSAAAAVSRWCPTWDDGDSADESAREARWRVEADVKAALSTVRLDDGRRCLFSASVDGARVGVVVARRAPAVPDRPDAVVRALNSFGATPLAGQLALLDVQNAPPRRLLFHPVADDVRVYVRCVAASDGGSGDAVPVFLLSGRDVGMPLVDAAAFGLDAADLATLQRAAARLLGAWT